MKLFKYKNILKTLLLSASSILLWGCTDDDFFIEDVNNPENGSGEGSYIEFIVNLASMTRDGSSSSDLSVGNALDFEKYEDYIDPENIRVLFFKAGEDEEGNRKDGYDTLIKAFDTGNGNVDNLSFIPIKNSTTSNTKEWYIRIPVSDYNGSFAKALRDDNFKIAVLANWDWKSDRTSDPAFSAGDPIKKLHHLSNEEKEVYNKGDAKGIYEFLFEGYKGKMGVYQDWVKNWEEPGYSSTLDWIRENWYHGYPGFKAGFEYKNLRVLWNFNGLLTNSEEDYDYNKSAWLNSNRADLLDWLTDNQKDGYYPAKRLANLQPIEDKFNLSFVGEEDEMFYPEDGTDPYPVIPKDKKYSRLVSGNGGKYGIALEKGEYRVDNNTTIIQYNVIKMNLEASGQLFIKWGSLEDNKTAALSIERRNNPNDSQPNSTDGEKEKDITPEATGQGIITTKIDYEIDNLEECLVIYSTGEGTPVIYEIEYVEDKHLNDTFRESYKLGTGVGESLIPMYGIQVFKAIDNWKEGTVYGLSNFNQLTPIQTPKKISMLRSVAKVELKLPRNTKEAPYHHVFLRSLNRYSRAEPTDVSTPTNDIWKDDTEADGSHIKSCEWFSLQAFVKNNGAFYTKTGNGSDAYQQKLAWYYGNWSDENGNVGSITPSPKESDINNYPHIMNPMISRSDFAQFIYMGAEGIYDRYIIYVPEKFVDDPSSVKKGNNMSNSNPKVCHIEFRGKNDDIKNMDDDWCYRIYFTKGGIGDSKYFPDMSDPSKTKINETWERIYEQNVDNLKEHWPIMRNHVYSFTVTDTDSRILIMDLKVLPWKNVQEDNSYDW